MSVSPDHSRRWKWGFAIFVVVITTLPYLLGYMNAGAQLAYSGFVIGVEDGNSYIAKMLSGAAGDWLFRTPYTAAEQKGSLAFLPYLLLGKLAGGEAVHTQLVALFHLFRVFGCFLFVFATFDFCRIFLEDPRLQRWGTVMATFGGGLGWLAIFGLKTGGYEQLPLEFYSPESFGFLGVFSLPHLAAARALLLWGMAAFLAPLRDKPFLQGAKAGWLWLLLGFMQPLTILTGWAVLGASMALRFVQIWERRSEKEWYMDALAAWRGRLMVAVGMVFVSSPMVLYNFLAFSLDPFLKGWSQQNLILSPPPGDYLLAYGLVLPFAVLGAVRAWKTSQWQFSLLTGWLLAFPFLAYFPYPLQRRLPEGVWVAWIILGLTGIEALRRRWQKPALAVIASGLLTTLIFYVGSLWTVTSQAAPLFLPKAETNAFTYLTEKAPPFSTILTSYKIGNSLPAWSPMRVVIGHGPESVDLAVLQPQVEAFFSSPGNEAGKMEFLIRLGVDYIFFGPDEQEPGGWDPTESSFLRTIYAQDGFAIYQLEKLPQP